MPNDWSTKVKSLIKNAKKEEAQGNPQNAIKLYQKALDLIPDPVEESVYATQLCSAIGEQYFLSKHYEEAFKYFSQAVRCKGGLGLAHIHLRLGQLRYERGELDRAKDELMRAYMGSGQMIFESEDQKYFNLIKEIAQKNLK